jgi:hypothetical protein
LLASTGKSQRPDFFRDKKNRSKNEYSGTKPPTVLA